MQDRRASNNHEFDLKLKCFVEKAKMIHQTFVPTLLCISDGNFIVATGGLNDGGLFAVKHAQFYDIDADKWAIMSSLKYPRIYHTSFKTKEFLYVFGGVDIRYSYSKNEQCLAERISLNNLLEEWKPIIVKNDLMTRVGRNPGSIVLNEEKVLIFGNSISNEEKCLIYNTKSRAIEKSFCSFEDDVNVKINYSKKIRNKHYFVNSRGGFITFNGYKFEKEEFDEMKHYLKLYMHGEVSTPTVPKDEKKCLIQ